MQKTKRTIQYISIAILSISAVGILSFEVISTSAQISDESDTPANGVVMVFGPDTDATQQDCINVGGTIHVNYDIGQYECILE